MRAEFICFCKLADDLGESAGPHETYKTVEVEVRGGWVLPGEENVNQEGKSQRCHRQAGQAGQEKEGRGGDFRPGSLRIGRLLRGATAGLQGGRSEVLLH